MAKGAVLGDERAGACEGRAAMGDERVEGETCGEEWGAGAALGEEREGGGGGVALGEERDDGGGGGRRPAERGASAAGPSGIV